MAGVVLPRSIPSASRWDLSDYRRLTLRTEPAAGNVAMATGPALALDELWLIDRAVASCTSVGASVLRLYDGHVTPAALLSGSDSGNYDEADYPAGLLIEPGRQLVAVWTYADNGAVGTLNLQMRVLRQARG